MSGANGGPVTLVDDREPKSATPRLREFGLHALEGRLDAGDYAFFPHGVRVLIERKTVSNLLGSMSTKQLVDQAHKLIDGSDFAIILIEGEYRRDPSGVVTYRSYDDPRSDGEGWVKSGWSWDSFTGILLDLKFMGIFIHDCPVSGEAPREIARIVLSLSKDEHNWIRERQRPTVIAIDKQYRNAVWSLCAFDGVGPEWAEALLRKFSRIDCVMAANEEALSLVEHEGKKFGKKRAARLHAQFEQEWSG